MKISTPTVMLVAALGVSGRPKSHGHAHKGFHIEKRMDFVINKKPDVLNKKPEVLSNKLEVPNIIKAASVSDAAPEQAFAPPPPPPPPPASSPSAPAPAAIPAPAAKPDPVPAPIPGLSSGPKKFCGGVTKRATLAQIAYKGNVGASGSYGCNVMMVNDPSGYDYTASFENKSGKDQRCVVWLKIGPTGGINGFFKGNHALTFDLPANSKKYLAAEENSQGGAACGPGGLKTTKFGQFADTWFEFDFANQSNGGYSGADISSLVAADNSLPIQAMKVCAKGSSQPCSVINDGGSGTNAYVGGTHDLDGVGLNISPGPIHFDVTVG
ncbi:hypothetical protein E4U41_003638 [Claviceps citrina]|nr:hypothetical protein E4U41_003638 [Claviceps citrina]